ncbi:MAG TPA: hypothetical protein VFS43_03675 [Polyangiaceae bacterium]|nr:hypothetical protein [Polyangiaceae bacterium]
METSTLATKPPGRTRSFSQGVFEAVGAAEALLEGYATIVGAPGENLEGCPEAAGG